MQAGWQRSAGVGMGVIELCAGQDEHRSGVRRERRGDVSKDDEQPEQGRELRRRVSGREQRDRNEHASDRVSEHDGGSVQHREREPEQPMQAGQHRGGVHSVGVVEQRAEQGSGRAGRRAERERDV